MRIPIEYKIETEKERETLFLSCVLLLPKTQIQFFSFFQTV